VRDNIVINDQSGDQYYAFYAKGTNNIITNNIVYQDFNLIGGNPIMTNSAGNISGTQPGRLSGVVSFQIQGGAYPNTMDISVAITRNVFEFTNVNNSTNVNVYELWGWNPAPWRHEFFTAADYNVFWFGAGADYRIRHTDPNRRMTVEQWNEFGNRGFDTNSQFGTVNPNLGLASLPSNFINFPSNAAALGIQPITIDRTQIGLQSNFVGRVEVPVASVAIQPQTLTLAPGDTGTLVAAISPVNATNRQTSWVSSNTAVATVDRGHITAVAEGTATITVTTQDGNHTATATVTVAEGIEEGPTFTEVAVWTPNTRIEHNNPTHHIGASRSVFNFPTLLPSDVFVIDADHISGEPLFLFFAGEEFWVPVGGWGATQTRSAQPSTRFDGYLEITVADLIESLGAGFTLADVHYLTIQVPDDSATFLHSVRLMRVSVDGDVDGYIPHILWTGEHVIQAWIDGLDVHHFQLPRGVFNVGDFSELDYIGFTYTGGPAEVFFGRYGAHWEAVTDRFELNRTHPSFPGLRVISVKDLLDTLTVPLSQVGSLVVHRRSIGGVEDITLTMITHWQYDDGTGGTGDGGDTGGGDWANNVVTPIRPRPTPSVSYDDAVLGTVSHEFITITEEDGLTTVAIADGAFAEIPAAVTDLIIPVPADAGSISVDFNISNIGLLNNANVNLIVASEAFEFHIPAGAIEYSVYEQGTTISIIIETDLPASDTALVASAVGAIGAEQVIEPIRFSVEIQNGGDRQPLTHFQRFTRRVVYVSAAEAAAISTAVVVNPDGTMRALPTNVRNVGGNWVVEVNSLTNNSLYSFITNTPILTDITGKWYYYIAQEAASRMIMIGMGDGTFGGEELLTRAQFASIIVRSLGLPETGNGSQNFTDVAPGAWYNRAVGTVYELGLMIGIGGGRFNPDGYVTWEQVMSILLRATAITEHTDRTAPNVAHLHIDFDDVSGWAQDSVVEYLRANLFVHEGKLRPVTPITRGEAAAAILRFLQESGFIDERSIINNFVIH